MNYANMSFFLMQKFSTIVRSKFKQGQFERALLNIQKNSLGTTCSEQFLDRLHVKSAKVPENKSCIELQTYNFASWRFLSSLEEFGEKCNVSFRFREVQSETNKHSQLQSSFQLCQRLNLKKCLQRKLKKHIRSTNFILVDFNVQWNFFETSTLQESGSETFSFNSV